MRSKTALLAPLLIVLAFQAWLRFSVYPATPMVSDDWAFISRAQAYPSATAVWGDFVHDKMRPVSQCFTLWVARLAGTDETAYSILSTIAYSISALLAFLCLYGILGRRRSALLAAILFCALPNCTGNFHWICVSLGGVLAFIAYLGSAAAWIWYLRKGGPLRLLLAYLGYLVGIFSYEVGFFLPAAFAILLLGRPWKLIAALLAPFALAAAFYAAWRLTGVFGLAGAWYGTPSQFELGFSLYGLLWTAREILYWWAGPHLLQAFLHAFRGFADIPSALQALLIAGDILLLAVLLLFDARKALSAPVPEDAAPAPAAPFPLPVAIAFAATWTAVTFLPPLLGYMASRLNYLPGLGIVLLLALLLAATLRRRPPHAGTTRLLHILLPAVLLPLMIAAQGSAANWRTASRLQHALADSLASTRAEWQDKAVLWLDTRALSDWLSGGRAPHSIDVVARYRDSELFRGFVPSAQVRQILQGAPAPAVLLDVEYGAHQAGDTLLWHERYNPDAPRQTPIADVYRLDVLSAIRPPLPTTHYPLTTNH